MRIDGHALLEKVLLEKAGYPSILHAVAEMTLFSHPATVSQTQNKNVFSIVRNAHKRGEIDPTMKVMFDDNNGPSRAFEWAIMSRLNWKDVQFNHIYSDSQNVELYTSLANLCVTPAFLAKLTDTDEAVKNLLKYRAYDLYGFLPQNEARPTRPKAYETLNWHRMPEPVMNLEEQYRTRMMTSLKNRASISAMEIGWLYSGFKPDKSLVRDWSKAA